MRCLKSRKTPASLGKIKFFLNQIKTLDNLSKCDGHTSNTVVVRSTLETGKNRKVDFALQVVHHLLAGLLVGAADAFPLRNKM